MITIPMVWNDSFYSEAAPLTSTTKQRDVVERLERLGRVERMLGPQLFTPQTRRIARGWIEKTHDPAYVEAVLTGKPLDLAQSQGFTWSPDFARSVVDIWAGYLYAANIAIVRKEQGLRLGKNLGDPTVVCPVSGAHHAHFARGSGFCTFNFLAGVAQVYATRRVLILDLDAHLGDGTLALIAQHQLENVAVFDIFGQMIEFTAPKFADRRFQLHGVEDGVAYMQALTELPALLDWFEPELVLYQAGVDGHYEDAVGGIPGLTRGFLGSRDTFVFKELRQRNIPTVVNLAGGYQQRSVDLHVQTISILSKLLNPARLAMEA